MTSQAVERVNKNDIESLNMAIVNENSKNVVIDT